MTDQRTLTVDLDAGSGGTKQYNVDNIAYLDVTDRSAKSISKVMATAGMTVIGLFYILVADISISAIVGGVAGLLVTISLLLYLKSDDDVTIGTVTSEDTISPQSVTDFEEMFLERSLQTIEIEGTADSLMQSVDYRYHFVPDNIVSVEYQASSIDIKELGSVVLVFLAGILLGILGVFPGVFIGALFGLVVATFLFLNYYFSKTSMVLIDLQGGVTREFEMNKSDATQFMRSLRERKSTTETAD